MSISSERKEDPSLMTEKEFYEKIDVAKEQVKNDELGPKFDSAMELMEYLQKQASLSV